MRTASMILLAWMLIPAATAQTQLPKPGPEFKKMDVFVGTWILQGNLKPGAMGPGGPVTDHETCQWMEGGFYQVCDSKYEGSMGTREELAVRGYSPDDKTYTYRAFDSLGHFEDSRGTLEGDTWTWTSEVKMGSMVMKGRFTMKMTSAASYNFAYETSADGTKWATVVEGKATKN
jgi:hypothetical protein